MSRNLSTTEVSRILGMPEARIRELARLGLCGAGRRGRAYAFSFQDLVVLRAAQELLGRKVPGGRVRRALAALVRELPEDRPLSGLRLYADGRHVAVRDEGTSYHYQPPARFSEAEPELATCIWEGLGCTGLTVLRGATWTTDAPFRETQAAVAAHRNAGLLAVEMEAAALYAFARARARDVLCFAHVTNRMAQRDVDFEKGAAGGAPDSLKLLAAASAAWRGGR